MIRLAVAIAFAFAVRAEALIRIVDGACAQTGDGTTLTCNAGNGHGPFKTVAEGIQALLPGDILEVRGARNGSSFDGRYPELPFMAPPIAGVNLPGKPVACSLNQPCFITGCRAADTNNVCQDELPVILGMQLHSDWQNVGAGIFTRTMESIIVPPATGGMRVAAGAANCPTQAQTGVPNGGCCPASNPNCGNYDPYTIYQDAGLGPRALGYDIDSDATPPEGKWSFNPNNNTITVHTIGGVNPQTVVYIPNDTYAAWIKPPTAYLALQHLIFWGYRLNGIDIGTSQQDIPGFSMLDVSLLFGNNIGVHFHGLPGMLFDGLHIAYGGQGRSFALTTGDTWFGCRGFTSNGGVIQNSLVEHGGCTGHIRWSGGSAWPCQKCSSPCNDPNFTFGSVTSIAYQIKQSAGFRWFNCTANDIQNAGFSVDVSRDVDLINSTVTKCGSCAGALDFTPSPSTGCDPTNPTNFCHYSDFNIDRMNCSDTGQDDTQHCAMSFGGDDSTVRFPGQSYLVRVRNSKFSRVGYAAFCTITDARARLPGGWEFSHNSIDGTTTGDGTNSRMAVIAVASPNDADVIANNIVDDVTGFLTFSSSVSPLLTSGLIAVDGNLYGLNSPGVMWGAVTPSSGQPSCPAGCSFGGPSAFHTAFPLQEIHGFSGVPQFVSPPDDLHLQNSSPARDVAIPLIPLDDHDGDNQFRPQGTTGTGYDIGYDEFFLGTTTTSTTTSTTSSTSSSTTSSTLTTTTTLAGNTTSSTTTSTSTTSTTFAGATTTSTLPPNSIIMRGKFSGCLGRASGCPH